MSTEKIYIGNAKIVNTKFGELTKGSMHKDDVNRIVKYMKDNNSDWINFEIKEKKNKVDGKPTHYIEVDTWKPDENKTKETASKVDEDNSDDDLPF